MSKGKIWKTLLIVIYCTLVGASKKRSIDLIQAHSLIADSRLPLDIIPNNYDLELIITPQNEEVSGKVKIEATWVNDIDKIHLHADDKLEINGVKVTQIGNDNEKNISSISQFSPVIIEVERNSIRRTSDDIIISLDKPMMQGSICEIEIGFMRNFSNRTTEAIVHSSYTDSRTKDTKWFVSTHLRPNLARKLFPCFDEPALKAPFTVHVARPKEMKAMSNMPLERTEPMKERPEWEWDHFMRSPPMSTFSVAVLVSEFVQISANNSEGLNIRVLARPDFISSLQNVTEQAKQIIKILENFWNLKFPLPKLDIVALPHFPASRPADSWGLLLFRESHLTSSGPWNLAHEINYQWLGNLASPYWWSDAHINTALVRYLTAYTVLKMDNNVSDNNWPMTMLYSLYYEFSKRYPHGKNTVFKQDSTSVKIELIFRMMNYTLGEQTLKEGLQKFMKDRQYKNFYGDDIWNSLTEQAQLNKMLDTNVSVNDIAASWILKDRLPVVEVSRNYDEKTAVMTQKLFLRERPHDVPDQDKFLWWIPIVLVSRTKLDFSSFKPKIWMKMEREIKINNVANSDEFIIVNPEEIGPFPVNYDERNWNMLSEFLQSGSRTQIPVNTRAKLIHDSWNLAYAGDLSFATALNMTLSLKEERESLVWDPLFTFIDHIGRHIENPRISGKFQTYIINLLTPLYEELSVERVQDENESQEHLRASSEVFLCGAGYRPCIEEAQAAYKGWMAMNNPDEGNPIANKYLCPVFKWGTWEEWYFGFQRVLQFPIDRKQNERTYLLKTLAGCPNDPETIEKLLNLTVLTQNEHIKDNDLNLIYNKLMGNPHGYKALLDFLSKNFDQLRKRFDSKPHLWNTLVTSATTPFKTQEGMDSILKLYEERKNDFGTADFVIEKALRDIKEEVAWSNKNLPVIENWLNGYLKKS